MTTAQLRAMVERVVSYDYGNEECNYRESIESGDIEAGSGSHIFETLRELSAWVDSGEGLDDVGDIVQVSGSDEIFTVAMVDYEPGGEPRYIAEDSRWLLHSAADIVERGPDYEEERNPKRYLVAGVRTFVVFNTEPAR